MGGLKQAVVLYGSIINKKPYNLKENRVSKVEIAHAGERLLSPSLVNKVSNTKNNYSVVNIVSEEPIWGFDVKNSVSHDFKFIRLQNNVDFQR
jgi:hypothetical protein